NLSGAAAIFVLAPLLSTVMGLGIPGLIFALFASNLLMALLGLALAIRRTRAVVFFKPMVSTLASTLLALLAVMMVQLFVASPLDIPDFRSVAEEIRRDPRHCQVFATQPILRHAYAREGDRAEGEGRVSTLLCRKRGAFCAAIRNQVAFGSHTSTFVPFV